MNGLLLNVICAFTIANANPNIEKAQQTLDALYQNYAAPNTCLYVRIILLTKTIRQLIWHQKNKQKDAMNIPTFGRIRARSLR